MSIIKTGFANSESFAMKWMIRVVQNDINHKQKNNSLLRVQSNNLKLDAEHQTEERYSKYGKMNAYNNLSIPPSLLSVL